MTSRKIDEVAADIDDAFRTVEELQAEPHTDTDTDTTDRLDDLHDTLEHASDAIDDIDDKDSGS